MTVFSIVLLQYEKNVLLSSDDFDVDVDVDLTGMKSVNQKN